MSRLVLLLSLIALASACATQSPRIPGTHVESTPENQTLIDRVEDYRVAVERRDASTLLLMASKRYWEDSGTPEGDDDYGFQGLSEVLSSRFQQVDGIRYSMKYMNIRRKGKRAYVDVLIDASFTLSDGRGKEVRTDMRDQNQFVLEWTGKHWLFLSGM